MIGQIQAHDEKNARRGYHLSTSRNGNFLPEVNIS